MPAPPTTRVVIAVVAGVCGIMATISLGMWQLRRAAERTAIEQAWSSARAAAPVVLRSMSDLAAIAANVPRRVRVHGAFDAAHSWWLDNRVLGGRAGFIVVTPLRIDDTTPVILVMRGWAPRDPAERTRLPPIGNPAGVVEVEGIAIDHLPQLYELGGASQGPIRQNLDFKDAAAELGRAVAPVVIQQISALDDGLERDWPPPASGAERNRGYAVQWFGLAALLTVLLLVFGLRSLRARSSLGRAA